jgi:hydrogenase-1 operon protein HyaF
MKRDNAAPCMSTLSTGMAFAIFSEICQRLRTLADHNEPSAIDLRSLPMTQSDRNQLEELLGRGEVSARLEIAGPSDIWETAFAGVWWIRHMGADKRIATEEIAITRIPEIFLSDPHDIAAAAGRMRENLETQKMFSSESDAEPEGLHVSP